MKKYIFKYDELYLSYDGLTFALVSDRSNATIFTEKELENFRNNGFDLDNLFEIGDEIEVEFNSFEYITAEHELEKIEV